MDKYEKKKIPKSDASRKAIETAVCGPEAAAGERGRRGDASPRRSRLTPAAAPQLRKHFLFTTLEDREIKEVIDAMAPIETHSDDEIIKQGAFVGHSGRASTGKRVRLPHLRSAVCAAAAQGVRATCFTWWRTAPLTWW